MTDIQKQEIISQFKGEVTERAMKAIRAKCLDCCCGQAVEVRLCPCNTCPLWPFRFGKSPYRKSKSRKAEEEDSDEE